MKSFAQYRALAHYVGIALLASIGGIIYLTKLTLTYEGNDIAQAGILIGILGTVASGILGVISGIVLGRHMAATEKKDEPSASAKG